MRNTLNKIIISFFLFILINFPSFSKSKDGNNGHKADMLYVLGFQNSSDLYKKQSKKNKDYFSYLFDLVNVMIDNSKPISYNQQEWRGSPTGEVLYRTGDNDRWYEEYIDYNFEDFSISNHRMMFHWGLEDDPKKVVALNDAFETWYNSKSKSPAYSDRNVWEDKFYSQIELAQLKRKTYLVTGVQDCFLLPHTGNDTFSISIAGILYYVHLLGDWMEHSENTNKTVEAVLPLNTIESGLNRYMKQLTQGGIQKEYKEYQKEMLKVHDTRDDRLRASRMVTALASSIPNILRRNYSSYLDRLEKRCDVKLLKMDYSYKPYNK